MTPDQPAHVEDLDPVLAVEADDQRANVEHVNADPRFAAIWESNLRRFVTENRVAGGDRLLGKCAALGADIGAALCQRRR